jgi:hypothetical protein
MRILKILTSGTVVLLFFNINACTQCLSCNSQDPVGETLVMDIMSQTNACTYHTDMSRNLKPRTGTVTIVR